MNVSFLRKEGNFILGHVYYTVHVARQAPSFGGGTKENCEDKKARKS